MEGDGADVVRRGLDPGHAPRCAGGPKARRISTPEVRQRAGQEHGVERDIVFGAVPTSPMVGAQQILEFPHLRPCAPATLGFSLRLRHDALRRRHQRLVGAPQLARQARDTRALRLCDRGDARRLRRALRRPRLRVHRAAGLRARLRPRPQGVPPLPPLLGRLDDRAPPPLRHRLHQEPGALHPRRARELPPPPRHPVDLPQHVGVGREGGPHGRVRDALARGAQPAQGPWPRLRHRARARTDAHPLDEHPNAEWLSHFSVGDAYANEEVGAPRAAE